MNRDPQASGDPIPPGCEVIEVHVVELKQLFNAIDPATFREKDLDPKAEEFIVGWAKDLDRNAPLALRVHVDRPTQHPDEFLVLREAVREFFSQQSLASRRRLRQLFRRGRTSLLIGFFFLAVSIGAGGLIESALAGQRIGEILRESLLIGGWVAMWRPLEIFLYDWWPIRADIRLFNRLSAMPVRVVYTGDVARSGISGAISEAGMPATTGVEGPAAGWLRT